MLTFRRFEALAESYGGDLRRWPEVERVAAAALLETSSEARSVLERARALDLAIAEANGWEDATLWHEGEPDAALARLRSGVAARIAPKAVRPPRWSGWRSGWALVGGGQWVMPGLLRQVGLVMGGGVAITAGVMIGRMQDAASAHVDLLAILQAPPLHGLW
jgi:hypothetical protein